VRTVSLIKEALLALLGSASAALLLFVCLRELTRSPGIQNATLNGMVPITTSKFPWAILIIVAAAALLLRTRAIGGSRGWLWGIRLWVLRAGFWWSLASLLLFVGVLIYGVCTQSLADLRWPFAIGYLAVMIPVLLALRIALTRTERSGSLPIRRPAEAS